MATVLVCICRTFQGCSRKVIYQICEWMAIIDFLLSPINYYLPCTPAEMTHCKYSRFQKSVLDRDGDLMIYCFFFLFSFFLLNLLLVFGFTLCSACFPNLSQVLLSEVIGSLQLSGDDPFDKKGGRLCFEKAFRAPAGLVL